MARWQIVFSLWTLLVLGFLSSCGLPGTETGNPKSPSQSTETATGGPEAAPPSAAGPGSADQTASAIDKLINDICARLDGCDSTLAVTTCATALQGIDGNGLGEKFGLSEDQFTVVEIRDGLSSGTIQVNATAGPVCESDISQIACSDVSSIFKSSDYSSVESLIPISCHSVLRSVP